MTEIVFGTLLLVGLILALTVLVVVARAVLVPDHPATLVINGQQRIATRTGQKLLTALADNGVLIPSGCAGAGTCGLCRVTIPQDGPEVLPVEAAR